MNLIRKLSKDINTTLVRMLILYVVATQCDTSTVWIVSVSVVVIVVVVVVVVVIL